TLSDKQDKEVKRAESSVTRLINLIRDLLDIERMEAGKMDMNIVDASLQVILDRSVEAVEALARERNITITVPEKDINVRVDGERIVQVVVNLLSNAIKFSRDKSNIAIELQPKSEWVEVKVIVNGRGIPAEMQQAVFERFRQVDASDAAEGRGSG